jgi:hypothetical protein
VAPDRCEAVDRYAAADHRAAVARCAPVDRCVAADRSAAADRSLAAARIAVVQLATADLSAREFRSSSRLDQIWDPVPHFVRAELVAVEFPAPQISAALP